MNTSKRMITLAVILAMIASMFGAIAEMEDATASPTAAAVVESTLAPASAEKEATDGANASASPEAGEGEKTEDVATPSEGAETAGDQNAETAEGGDSTDDVNDPEITASEGTDEAKAEAPAGDDAEDSVPEAGAEETNPQAPDGDAAPDAGSDVEDEAAADVMLLAGEPTEVSNLDGTTSAVDNSTTLADGSYVPEDFSYSGGSGRTRISCTAVQVSGGKATASISINSAKYQYVKASGGKYDARHDGSTSMFEIPIALNENNRIIGMTTAMSETGTEVEYTIFVKLTEPANVPADDSEDVQQGDSGDDSTDASEQGDPSDGSTDASEQEQVYEDGDYEIAIDSTFKMFAITSKRAKVEGGKIIVTIGTSKTTYDRIYIGSKNAESNYPNYVQGVANSSGGYDFTFELPQSYMGKSIDFVPGKADGSWYSNNQYQLTIPATIEKAPSDNNEPDAEEPTKVEDGEYNVTVESSAAMFKVVACKLTAKDGAYSAVITLSGTGYDKLYMGTAEAAASADASTLIPFVVDGEGKYTFAVPVEKLDEGIAVAAHSVSKDLWYDRTLTFKSEGMERIDVPAATLSPDATPTPTPSPEPTATPEPDLNGSTSRVDNSTTLADGTYTPDKFSFSGGTGKVSISCPRITVSGGKATATIVFSSSNYSYVKANGRKYYGSHGGGTSTFEIPIKLNSNNKVIGMTTAMSMDHEVSYTMYFYIKAAEQSAKDDAAADAPEIAGLAFSSKDAIGDARLFEIYRYEGGFIAIKVADVGTYLIVPEGAELPVGIEEEMTVIQRPVESAYVAFEEMFDLIAQTGSAEAADAVRAVGYEVDAELPVYAGSCTEPNYAALLQESIDLAIVHEQFADARVLGTADAPEAYLREELSDEDAALMAEVAGRLDMLGIPMFVDRSFDEESERARLEWIKVYGVLFDCEEAANAGFEAAVAGLPEAA